MMKHILTTEEIVFDSHLNPRDIPIINALLNKWEANAATDKKEYEILIFFLEDILSWCPIEDKFFIDRLQYLLIHGRRTKQLVIMQVANIDNLKQIEGSLLHYLLIYNAQPIYLTGRKSS